MKQTYHSYCVSLFLSLSLLLQNHLTFEPLTKNYCGEGGRDWGRGYYSIVQINSVWSLSHIQQTIIVNDLNHCNCRIKVDPRVQVSSLQQVDEE